MRHLPRDYTGVRMVFSGHMRALAGLRSRESSGWIVVLAFITSCQQPPAPPAEGPAVDTPQPRRELQVGDRAPDFSLPGSDDRTYRLADYRGRQAVVLAWFAKAFTGG